MDWMRHASILVGNLGDFRSKRFRAKSRRFKIEIVKRFVAAPQYGLDKLNFLGICTNFGKERALAAETLQDVAAECSHLGDEVMYGIRRW